MSLFECRSCVECRQRQSSVKNLIVKKEKQTNFSLIFRAFELNTNHKICVFHFRDSLNSARISKRCGFTCVRREKSRKVSGRVEFIKKLLHNHFVPIRFHFYFNKLIIFKYFREFINKHYVTLKQANPKTPILIRECSGVQPRLWARYGK